MNSCTYMKKYIFTILIMTMPTENLLAASWNSYFYNIMPSRERIMQGAYSLASQLTSLTRPQFNPQWFSRLTYQWQNLTPRQKNIILYMALFGAGGPGIAYWQQRQRFNEEQEERNRLYMQRQAEINAIIEKIPASLREIDAKLNSSKEMSYADLNSLKEQLDKNLEDLNRIKNEIEEVSYYAPSETSTY